MTSKRPSLGPGVPFASSEETAAIVAALKLFALGTASPARPAAEARDGWQAAALREGVSRDPWATTTSDEWLSATPG